MNWLLPSLLSAVALGVYDLFKKHAVRENSVMPVLFWATVSGTLFLLIVSAAHGRLLTALPCPPAHFWLTMLKSVIVSASWICVYYAMRDLPITLASPIRSSAPLWTAIGGILIYREIPTPFQALGMAIVLTGYALFSYLGKHEGFSWKSRGMVLIILGTLFGAVSALYDKFLLNVIRIDRETMQLWFSIDLLLILGIAYGVRRCFGHKHPFQWRWTIPATGIALIVADYVYFYAVSLPEAPISMISLVRRCSCAVSFAAGVRIFHDGNWKRKALALAILLAGVALLALGHR